MTDTFKGIVTADGKKRQLPYRNILEIPISDPSLNVEGGFADSAVVGKKFKKTDDDIASLKEDLDYYTGNTKIEITENGYRTTGVEIGDSIDLTIQPSDNYYTKEVECSGNDVFLVTCNSSYHARAWCFVDSNNVCLSVASSSVTCDKTKIIAPIGASKLIVNAIKYYDYGLIKNGLVRDDIDVLRKRVEPLEKLKTECVNDNLDFTLNGYVQSNGNISNDTSAKRTDYCPVLGYTKIKAYTAISSSGYAIAFYDKDQNLLIDKSVLGKGSVLSNYECDIPTDASYVIVSEYGKTEYSATLIKEDNLQSRVEALEDEKQTDYTELYEGSSFGAFAKWGLVGDSLSVGHTRKADGTETGRNIYYSWGQYLARRCGNICLNFGKTGMTAKSWMSNELCYTRLINENNKCQAYVIALGINDAEQIRDNTGTYTNGIGSTADIDFSDMSNNADSFFGWYAKIINTINTINEKAIVFLFTMPAPRGDIEAYANINEAIVALSKLSGFRNVVLVDLRQYNEQFKANGINNQIWGGHFNAIGYSNVSRINEIALSKAMNDYNTSTRMYYEIPFIPYGSNNSLD